MSNVLKISISSKNTITLIYNEMHNAKVLNILDLCQKNPLSNTLLDKLISTYPDAVIRMTDDPLLFSNGRWLPKLSEINIKDCLSLEETLQTLVFECCNALNPAFNPSHLNQKEFSTADEYAQFMEKSEFVSYKIAYQIYLKGIEVANWPKPQDITRFSDALSLDIWMQKAKRKTDFYKGANSHYNGYINYFNSVKIGSNH